MLAKNISKYLETLIKSLKMIAVGIDKSTHFNKKL